MKLIYHPDEFLEKKLKDVDIKNPSFDPIELKEKMIDFMLSNNGIGLSASQIGMDAQVFPFNGTVEPNQTAYMFLEISLAISEEKNRKF